MGADRRSGKGKHFDLEIRSLLTAFLLDPHESDGSLLDLEAATRVTLSDFRKDRLRKKGGHGKPVNTPGNGGGGGGGGEGGGGEPGAVASVSVTPSPFTITTIGTQQLTPVARDSTGTVLSGKTFTYESSNAGVATVSVGGLVTAVATGTVAITVTCETITGTASGTVTAVPVATVTVSPSTFSKTVGQTQQLTATLRDSLGNVLTGRAIQWSTSSPAIATVTASGLVTAIAAGSVTIGASSEGKAGTSAGTVSAAPPAAVATVTISPSSFSKAVGQTQLLIATVRDASNNILTGRVVTWASSAPLVATVTTPGQSATLTAVAVGSSTITATCETVPGTASATITAVPVAQVIVSPATFSVAIGGTQQLTAVTKDALGNTLTGRVVTWQSSSPSIATVSSTGLVTGVGNGSCTITATSEGINGISACAVPGAGSSDYSPLDAPSTTIYNPRPHPWTVPSALPQTFLDTRYDPGGVALTWANDELLVDQGSQAANLTYLNAKIVTAAGVAGHTRLRLPDNFLCYDPRFRKNTQGNYWLYVEWDGLAVAEGTRVTPSDMTSAPVFHSRGATSDAGHCMQFDRQANRIRLVGIKCTATASESIFDMVSVEPKESSVEFSNNIANINEWVILDRILVQGNDAGTGSTGNVRNGVRLDGRRCALIDSYIHQIGKAGTESHAVVAWNTPGPVKVVNNFIEGTSCCFFLGGARPAYGDAVGRPTDFEVRRNHMTRRLTWNPEHGSWDGQSGRGVKNSLETKNVQRILIEGNVIERTWASGQQGMIIVIKSGEGNEVGPTAGSGQGSEDVTLRYNFVRDGVMAFNVQGIDDQGSILAKRIAYYHNLSYGIGNYTGDNRAFLITHKVDDLYIRFNTIVATSASAPTLFAHGGVGNADAFVGLAERFVCADNLAAIAYTAYDSGANHIAGVNQWANTATRTFERNVFIGSGDWAGLYPVSTQFAANTAAVQFVNTGASNYRLAGGSPYKGDAFGGADPGCAVDDVETATSGVV